MTQCHTDTINRIWTSTKFWNSAVSQTSINSLVSLHLKMNRKRKAHRKKRLRKETCLCLWCPGRRRKLNRRQLRSVWGLLKASWMKIGRPKRNARRLMLLPSLSLLCLMHWKTSRVSRIQMWLLWVHWLTHPQKKNYWRESLRRLRKVFNSLQLQVQVKMNLQMRKNASF